MPNRSYKGAQRIVYLTPALELAVKQYLGRHKETTFSPWMRQLIQECIEKDTNRLGTAQEPERDAIDTGIQDLSS